MGATTRDGWIAKGTRTIALPSGVEVVVRQPHLLDLLELGYVPGILTTKVAELAADPDFTMSSLDDEDYAEFGRLMRYTIAAAVIDPPITPEDVRSLPAADVEELREQLMRVREVARLEPFRDEPDGAPVRAELTDVRP